MMCHSHFIWKLHGSQKSKQIHYIIFKRRLSVVCRLLDSCSSNLLQTLYKWPPSVFFWALCGWIVILVSTRTVFPTKTVFPVKQLHTYLLPKYYFFLAWGMKCLLYKCNICWDFLGGCWLSIIINKKHFKQHQQQKQILFSALLAFVLMSALSFFGLWKQSWKDESKST